MIDYDRVIIGEQTRYGSVIRVFVEYGEGLMYSLV